MPTLFEYNNTNHNNDSEVRSNLWEAQTFTPQIDHKITSVKLLLWRVGSPGILTVSIKATSSGLPTGSDLVSGTTDGDTLTTDTGGEWREISLGDGYALSASTEYAIVVRALNGDGSNEVEWGAHVQLPDAQYPRGTECASSDSGSSWTANNNWDMQFEDWGTARQHYQLGAYKRQP